MKFRRIPISIACWWILSTFTMCGQGSPSTQTVEGSPIDRHISRLILTHHARCRMDCRHITEKELREILEEGEINYRKSEPDAHPDPKYALEGHTREGQHLRVVFAVPKGRRGAEGALVVVTCIDLEEEWQCDCK